MTGTELQQILDDLGLSEAEAARLLYITPLALWRLVHGERKIRGPLIAAVEGWQRHGPPPDARLVTDEVEPTKLKLMKKLRDSLDDEPASAPPKKRSRTKPGSAPAKTRRKRRLTLD